MTDGRPSIPRKCFRCGSRTGLVAIKLKVSTQYECKNRAACEAQCVLNREWLRSIANG